jgi:hypothetical protein
LAAARAKANIPAASRVNAARLKASLVVSMVNEIEFVVWIGFTLVAIRPTAR